MVFSPNLGSISWPWLDSPQLESLLCFAGQHLDQTAVGTVYVKKLGNPQHGYRFPLGFSLTMKRMGSPPNGETVSLLFDACWGFLLGGVFSGEPGESGHEPAGAAGAAEFGRLRGHGAPGLPGLGWVGGWVGGLVWVGYFRSTLFGVPFNHLVGGILTPAHVCFLRGFELEVGCRKGFRPDLGD